VGGVSEWGGGGVAWGMGVPYVLDQSDNAIASLQMCGYEWDFRAGYGGDVGSLAFFSSRVIHFHFSQFCQWVWC
jgi:hypothetical protein